MSSPISWPKCPTITSSSHQNITTASAFNTCSVVWNSTFYRHSLLDNFKSGPHSRFIALSATFVSWCDQPKPIFRCGVEHGIIYQLEKLLLQAQGYSWDHMRALLKNISSICCTRGPPTVGGKIRKGKVACGINCKYSCIHQCDFVEDLDVYVCLHVRHYPNDSPHTWQENLDLMIRAQSPLANDMSFNINVCLLLDNLRVFFTLQISVFSSFWNYRPF